MPTSVIAAATVLYEAYQTYQVVAFAVNMVASAIISKAFFSPQTYDQSGAGQNLGNPQQLPPATNNKLPIVYGQAYVGGIVADLSISADNQQMYYVIALSEVTGVNTADNFTFGDIYWGGKKVNFDTNGYSVASLTDPSTGAVDTAVKGYMDIYLFKNGSYSGVNTSQSAIQIMQNSSLVYKWDSTKLMTSCVFAIVHLTYNQGANVTGLQQTLFQITNSRYAPGDVLQDYLLSDRYGAAIPTSQIDTTSLTALNTYSAQNVTYNLYAGGTSTITRFRFDGVVDTSQSIMTNLQNMASCADCLIKYNEITAQWGVIVQQPTYTVAMDINDSNMTSAIIISPLDITSSYNIAQVQFPDKTQLNTFNSATFDLAEIDPTLLFPNEPVNQQTITLPYVNDNVRAQLIANRFLKSCREDLQVQVNVNFVGLQLEAGDIVTLTNANYGWVAKLFRISKVIQSVENNGVITCALTLMEFNPAVYDDASITEFAPSDNTGIPNPLFFGTINAPTISNILATAVNPSFDVNITSSSAGIVQYAEVWYSAFATPTASQLIFAGTTAIQSNGDPYPSSYAMPAVTLTSIPAGNWYFFTRMVNSLGTSVYSSASSVLNWRPYTFQFSQKYLSVAYADDSSGGGFSFSPTNKTYFGLCNQDSTTPNSGASAYTWYLAVTPFSTDKYLLFTNRTGRKFSFDTGTAGYAAGSGSFVPTDATLFDPSIWGGLPLGSNIIDLDYRAGQLIETGTTTVGTGEIAISNNDQGVVVASLAQLLNFGTGVYTKTASAATITIDIYGRVVGFESPDDFYYSMTAFTATAGETVFSVTRGSGYITGQCLVFENGLLMNPSDYTDSSSAVTFGTGRTAGDIITVISFKSVNTGTPYASFTRNSATLTNQSTYTASGFTLVSGNELLFLNGTVVNSQDYDIVGQDITFIGNATGDLEIIQWTNNNLGVPNGTPVNVDTYTVIGQTLYSFSYDPNAFNLYNNGVLQLETVDYSVATGSYTLATAPTANTNILVQQTFNRTGAV